MPALAGGHVKNACFFVARRNDEALRGAKARTGNAGLVKVACQRLVRRIEQGPKRRDGQGQSMLDRRVTERAPGECIQLAVRLGLDFRKQLGESRVDNFVPALEARGNEAPGLFADQSPGRFVGLGVAKRTAPGLVSGVAMSGILAM